MSEPTAADIFSDDGPSEIEIRTEMARESVRREARRRLDAAVRGSRDLPKALTLRERLALPGPIVQWRIENWQPVNSRVVLAAQYKAGKTTLVASLLRSLADGAPWLGRDRVTRVNGNVLLLDTEMSPAQLDDWHRAQRIERDDHIVVMLLRGQVDSLNLLDDGVRARWAAELRRLRVEYLILDCLRPVLDALGLDEHREAGRFLTLLDALLREASVADCFVAHHMGHGNERARGDSRIRDWPDCEWRIVRRNDEPSSPRFISAYGRDVDISESALQFDDETRALTIIGGSRRDAGVREALSTVFDLLKETSNPLCTGDIEDALKGKHARAVVRAALDLGIGDGLITRRPGAKRAWLHQLAKAPQCAASAPAQSHVSAPALI